MGGQLAESSGEQFGEPLGRLFGESSGGQSSRQFGEQRGEPSGQQFSRQFGESPGKSLRGEFGGQPGEQLGEQSGESFGEQLGEPFTRPKVRLTPHGVCLFFCRMSASPPPAVDPDARDMTGMSDIPGRVPGTIHGFLAVFRLPRRSWSDRPRSRKPGLILLTWVLISC